MVEQFGGFLNAVFLSHILWLTPNRTHTWYFKLVHKNTVCTHVYCACLYVLQVVAFFCGNDGLSVMPQFPQTPRNITEKSGPSSNANNVSSRDDCLECVPRHRLTEGCSFPVRRLASRPISGEEFQVLAHDLQSITRYRTIIQCYVVWSYLVSFNTSYNK